MEPSLKKKKIIYLITKSNWGGAQRYVFDLATKASSHNFDVQVIVGGNGPLADKLRVANIPVVTMERLGRDVSPLKDFGVLSKLYSIFKKEKPDIIHLNSSKIGGLGALAGRLAGIKTIIFTAHGWAFNENRSLPSKIAISVAYWITLFFSHQTIAVSKMMKDQASWPLVKDKIQVIHNGIALEPGFSRTNARHELLKYSEKLHAVVKATKATDLFWVGTIAELHPIKGYEYAIKAIKELVVRLQEKGVNKKIVYTIIGNGEDKERLHALVKEYGLEDTIFFLGHVDQAAYYLKAFDVFLLASLSEGLAYVLIEAGSASVPVVATNVGGIPELIDDMKSGILIRSQQHQEITHALEFLIHHKVVLHEHGKALRDKVVTAFNLNKMSSATFAVYAKTTEGRQTRSS